MSSGTTTVQPFFPPDEDQPLITMSPEMARMFAVDSVAQAVAQPVIDRSYATAEYGFVQNAQALWLKVKKTFTKLDAAEINTLTKYDQHNAALDGIKKVSQAFDAYVEAAKVVKTAKDATQTLPARIEEQKKGRELIASYNAMIALAANRADAADYKKDLHKALNTKDELIFKTVNAVLAKEQVKFGMGETEELQAAVLKFITSFPSHVTKVASSVGSSDADTLRQITDHFIMGLASIPELAKDRKSVV